MVDLYICEPVSGGADTLPHGQPLGGSDHMWWEHVSAGHLMKIIFHCQENIWISIAEPAARASTQSRSLLIIFRVEESKSDRGKIFTFDILPRDDVTRPHTRGKIVITVWAISRESSGTMRVTFAALWLVTGAQWSPLIGHWGAVKSSDWSESWTLYWQLPTGPGIYWSVTQHLIFS